MTDAQPIRIQAVVEASEEAAVRQAADLLAASLAQAGGVAYFVECDFAAGLDKLDKLDRAPSGAILVASLLGEAANLDEPWPQTEQRLRATYRTLAEDGRFTVFLCTVLRHVPADGAPERAMARLVRIRRLNLLAAELSQESGIFIIDIDRDLADIGARALHTDWRLDGQYAAGVAAKAIVLTLLSAGLDAAVPIEVQEAARTIVAAHRPASAAAIAAPVARIGVNRVASRATGGRTQFVLPVNHADDARQVDFQLRRLMRGQIDVRAAATMLMRSVGQHGLRSTAGRVLAGIARQVRNRSPAAK